MKRISLTFLFAIILPAIVLAGFGLYAVRAQNQILTLQEEEILLNKAEGIATEVDGFFDDLRVFYGEELDQFLNDYNGSKIEDDFSNQFPERWNQISSAAAIAAGQETVKMGKDSENDTSFFQKNSDLWKQADSPVVSQAPALILNRAAEALGKTKQNLPETKKKVALNSIEPQQRQRGALLNEGMLDISKSTIPPAPSSSKPSRETQSASLPSRPMATPFSLALTQRDPEGAFTRMHDGEIHTLFWRNHPNYPELTFWVEVDQQAIIEGIERIVSFVPFSKLEHAAPIATQVHNIRGQLVAHSAYAEPNATSRAQTSLSPLLPNWTVTAIGSPAPFWARFSQQLSLITILFFLALVLLASWLLIRSMRAEMRLAAQKTDFVGNVSHELKTPLTSIRMFSEMLQQNSGADAEKVSSYAGVIEKESRRLGRLIHRLLDFSQLDRGTMKLDTSRVDLRTITESAIKLCRADLEKTGMETTLEWGSPSSLTIDGDEDLLTQVIVNLLTNACKYAAQGRVIHISSREEETGKKLTLTVADRGPGIPKNALRKVFEKFHRLDNSLTSEQSGAGIGLALCQEIIQLHGGSISARNRHGGGAAFEVHLPIATQETS